MKKPFFVALPLAAQEVIDTSAQTEIQPPGRPF
jgi:hypothetical protein